MNQGSNYRKITVQNIENQLRFELQKMNWVQITENELGFKLKKFNQGSNNRKVIRIQIKKNELE